MPIGPTCRGVDKTRGNGAAVTEFGDSVSGSVGLVTPSAGEDADNDKLPPPRLAFTPSPLPGGMKQNPVDYRRSDRTSGSPTHRHARTKATVKQRNLPHNNTVSFMLGVILAVKKTALLVVCLTR